MQRSDDRILTTHVGSLPRSKAVTDVIFAREEGRRPPGGDEVIAAAVDAVVARQVESGIDVVSDGEMSKISYATYIKDRITGFEGDSRRGTWKNFPVFFSVRRHPAARPPTGDRAASARSPSRTWARWAWTSPTSQPLSSGTGRPKGS